MTKSKGMQTPPGPAVDISGQTTLDPSDNVRALNVAAVQRLDDLRAAAADKAAAEFKHLKEIADLRAEHYREMLVAEAARIDAIRAVDVGAVQRAAEVQATQALTLATQVTTSAEALRASQAASAALADTKLVTALEPIQKRIDDLSRAQYEAVGIKQQAVETTSSSRSSLGLWIAGLGLASAFILGIAGVLIAVLLR